jgi:membrane associated rhomboid family serine protease
VVTALFLHSGWFHYLGNMAYLWAFGPPLEERLGRARFLLYFVLAGCFGNIVHGVAALNGWFGAGGFGVLGASGSIAGLLALTLLRCPFARVVVAYWVLAALQGQSRAGRIRLGLPVAVGGWLLFQVVHALVAMETGDGVSYAAHLGGFVLGVILGVAMGLARDGGAESHLLAGRRYLDRGAAFAAAGAFREYLALNPGCRQGRLELARALRMAGQADAASQQYKAVLADDTDAKRLDRAAAVFAEVRRGYAPAAMDPDLLAHGAWLQDRQLDFAGALSTYQDLVEYFPHHPRHDFALVRIATLLRGPLGDEEKAHRWIERALKVLPPGAWRDFLVTDATPSKGS